MDKIKDVERSKEEKFKDYLEWLDFELRSRYPIAEHRVVYAHELCGDLLIARGHPPHIKPLMGAFLCYAYGCQAVRADKLGEARLNLFIEDMLSDCREDRLEYAEDVCLGLSAFYELLEEIKVVKSAKPKLKTIAKILRRIQQEFKQYGATLSTRH